MKTTNTSISFTFHWLIFSLMQFLIERGAWKCSFAVYPERKRNRYIQFIESVNFVSLKLLSCTLNVQYIMLRELRRNALSVYISYCTDIGGKSYFKGRCGSLPLFQRK